MIECVYVYVYVRIAFKHKAGTFQKVNNPKVYAKLITAKH